MAAIKELLYPTNRYFAPNCWVLSYPAVGYNRTYSLGTIGLVRWVR